ncbi:HlyD family secretion protein [Nitrospirillum sp. BR 11163]|uniref:HlyD family secretion protein n=1 Tax=Nitrospirillum sp. BR 11163 TaxID=3104323 RepID=UPI002AFFFCB8|nr:HlyD family efflux transporter periplasmic adaptor subunit [Nitrospirillum sp. BR 11163]MEA1676157.1 HlyD family efflux transporter periplasmic adaptor subunit [Nitrospirillum sp. BR 11163]
MTAPPATAEDGAPAPAVIFRSEVMAQQRYRLYGDVVIEAPRLYRRMVILLGAIIVFAIGVLTVCQYARKETVSGYLTPNLGLSKVLVPRTGIASQILAAEGTHVTADAPLMAVTVDTWRADGQNSDERELTELRAQKAELERQIALGQQQEDSEHSRYLSRLASLKEDLAGLRAKKQFQAERLQFTGSRLARTEELMKAGYAATVDWETRKDAALQAQQDLVTTNRDIGDVERQMRDIQASLEQGPIQLGAKLSTLRASISDLGQKIEEIEARRAYVVKAPVAGRVVSVQVKAGEAVTNGQFAMGVVPDGAQLEAEMMVPTRAIGFVKPGQDVRMMYDAFPYQRFGTFGGKIKSVSRTVLAPAEANVPFAVGEPVYKVVAALDGQAISVMDTPYDLQSGMLFKANIVLERRPLIAWILEPLYGAHLE